MFIFLKSVGTGLLALRFVDRDMLMRYHWGLGIGHRYSWEGPQPQPLSAALTEVMHAVQEGESQTQTLPEPLQSGMDKTLGVPQDSMDHIPSEPDKPQEQGAHSDDAGPSYSDLLDGMEDRENEDLGDDTDWSDDDNYDKDRNSLRDLNVYDDE